MKRRIFIGDIQGCREELEKLLEAVGFDPSADELHPVGDLVNRGPDSLGTLRLLRRLDAGGVTGNHDSHLLRVAAGTRKRGAKDTIADVLAAPDRDELLRWLAARPFVRVWEDVTLVHGGLSPAWKDPAAILRDADPLRPDADAAFAMLVRYCDSLGRRPEKDWPEPPLPYAPWWIHHRAARGKGPAVVFGHWARQGLLVRGKIRGIDTACVWGGQLTAWIAEEDRLVQVPAARQYADPSVD